MPADDDAAPLVPAEWAELMAVMTKFLGSNTVTEMFRLFTTGDGLAAMANPATFIHQNAQRFGQMWRTENRLEEGDTEPFLVGILTTLRSTMSALLDDAEVLGSQRGQDVFTFLKAVADSKGVEALVECFRDHDTSTLWSLGTVRAMLSLHRVNAAEVPGPFEQRVREVVQALTDAAERWYKPILQVLLRMEHLKRGTTEVDPTTIGGTFNACERFWKVCGPLSVMDPNIRLVRNADGHSEAEVDPETEQIKFTNRPGGGRPLQVLGPWSERRLREFSEECLMRYGIISLACVAFIAEEVGRRMDQQGGKLDPV